MTAQNHVYEQDKKLEKIDFTLKVFPAGEYEGCVFDGCNFSSADLFETVFSDCEFSRCNLSTANLKGTGFREMRFKDCKLLGLRFYECSEFLFSADFVNCHLNLSSFYNLKIKNTRFKDSSLSEADFAGADLTKAIFENCDLRGATYESSILEKVDFRTAYNYSFDPELNRLKGAKFSRDGIAGLLSKYDIEIE